MSEALAIMPASVLVEEISAAAAAVRLERSAQWVGMLCKQWQHEGKARRVMCGGRVEWRIRIDADPALAVVKECTAKPLPDIITLTDEQRAEWRERVEIYLAWDKAKRAAVRAGGTNQQATDKYLAELAERGISISEERLRRWHKAYRRAGEGGLIDERWRHKGGREAPPADDRFFQEFARYYLHPNRRSVARCYDLAVSKAKECGWEVRSIAQTRRYVATLPPAVKIRRRGGREAFNKQAEPYFVRDYTTANSNTLWNCDHTRFDVLLEVAAEKNERGEIVRRHARPWLTSWQDIRSRKIMAWAIYLDDPNTDYILSTFREACLEHGVPEGGYVDNGKDFDSFELRGRTKKQRRNFQVSDGDAVAGVFKTMGVELRNVRPWRGQSKPIERFHGTMEDRFSKLWESYCGNKPENKPEGLQSRLDRGEAPNLAEFTEKFRTWVEGDYNARPHTGQGMAGKSPNEVFKEHLTVKRTATAEMLELLLLKTSRPTKVTRNGVLWDKIGYGHFAPELKAHLGEQVILRVNPNDVRAVSVWTLDGKFICRADSNRTLPVNADRAVVREAIKEQKNDRKAQLNFQEARLRMHEDLPERAHRLAGERAAAAAAIPPDPDLPPPSIRPIRSPMEEQLPQHQRQMQPLRRTGTDDVQEHPRFQYTRDPSRFEGEAPSPRFEYGRDVQSREYFNRVAAAYERANDGGDDGAAGMPQTQADFLERMSQGGAERQPYKPMFSLTDPLGDDDENS